MERLQFSTETVRRQFTAAYSVQENTCNNSQTLKVAFSAFRKKRTTHVALETTQLTRRNQLLNGTSAHYRTGIHSAVKSWLTIAIKTDNN